MEGDGGGEVIGGDVAEASVMALLRLLLEDGSLVPSGAIFPSSSREDSLSGGSDLD